MGAPAGNAVKHSGWRHRFCRTCSTQRMPSGHDKAVEEPRQPNCLTNAKTGIFFTAAVRGDALIKQLNIDIPVQS